MIVRHEWPPGSHHPGLPWQRRQRLRVAWRRVRVDL